MRMIFLLLLASLIIPAARADDATKCAKIEELMTVTRVEQLMQQQQAQMPALIHQMMAQSAPNMASNPALDKMVQEVVSEAQAATTFESMKPEFVRIYSEVLTEDEITGLVTFYRSSLGQTTIEKMPTVMAKTMEVVQARMMTILPKLQQHVQEMMSAPSQPEK